MKTKKFREPLTNTQLLMTITICIFFAMYILSMVFLGGGFLRIPRGILCFKGRRFHGDDTLCGPPGSGGNPGQ